MDSVDKWSAAYDRLKDAREVLRNHLALPPSDPARMTAIVRHQKALAEYNKCSEEIE